jgi:hypothetical protein
MGRSPQARLVDRQDLTYSSGNESFKSHVTEKLKKNFKVEIMTLSTKYPYLQESLKNKVTKSSDAEKFILSRCKHSTWVADGAHQTFT